MHGVSSWHRWVARVCVVAELLQSAVLGLLAAASSLTAASLDTARDVVLGLPRPPDFGDVAVWLDAG